MTKRPSVMSLDDLMGASPKPESEPVVQPAPPPPAPPEPEKTVPASAAAVTGEKADKTFRTSIYFHRSVHDVLRDIAHAERKNISDLINEGLDHVLKKRGHPTTGKLRASTKA